MSGNEDNDHELDDDLKIVQKHINQLAEHFETVQVFVTKRGEKNTDDTTRISYGSGNWFARYGQINLWLRGENAVDAKVHERRAEEE